MKNTFIIACICLLSSTTLVAQENVVLFQVDNNNYVQLEKYKPFTKLEYYSTSQGGKHLGKIKTDQHGFVKEQFDVDNTPAFVLNRQTNENIEGTNKVYFLDHKEFVAKDINFDVIAGTTNISWKAQINEDNNISFQLFKNDQNGNSTLIKTIQGIKNNEFNTYEYTEPYKENASYSIHIVKDNSILRYASSKLNEYNDYQINVYPTICNDQLYIDLPELNEENPCFYEVKTLSGQTVMKGIFKSLHNSLNILQLNTGNYILILNQNINTKVVKFSKVN
jgi:hypothetical protein